MKVQLGIDRLLHEETARLEGKRFGLLVNQASVTGDLQYSVDAISKRFRGGLTALFTPQHGMWGEQQANMIETSDEVDSRREIPIYSLYADVRRPSAEMLEGLDCMVIDLQDVGTRVYTYIWTLSLCLEACAEAGVPVLVLDRPNPLGGQIVEGPNLQTDFGSFVGRYEIPMRHGLTVAEFAAWANEEYEIGADLSVLPMEDWERSMGFSEAGLVWVPPSPNMPRVETAMLYPGMVLLEGTNMSEGRGTTRPFEVVGAPFIDSELLADELNQYEWPGLEILPTRFEPTFDKWQGQSCGGVAFYITDAAAVRSYKLVIAILSIVRKHWTREFEWLPPPYEYEYEKPPIDILSGSDGLRLALESDVDRTELLNKHAAADDLWLEQAKSFLLY